MAIIGSVNQQGAIQGQINTANGYVTGVISSAELISGNVVGMRGLQGEKGDTGDTGATGADGADGFSPSASVSKVGHTATITITDKDGTTTADVYDGSGGGASAFIAEYGVTTYADVKDAYDEDAIILCTVDDSGNTVICQLAYYDDANGIFYFAQPQSDGFYLAIVAIDDTWDDSYFQFASTDTATQLRNGLMDALDKQKLDTIASGAEVNVQSDWNEADNTKDDYIKNKPTIPSKTSDLNNDSGFITGVTSTSTPTASTIAEFDSSSCMNSTDMTSQEVSDFVDDLSYESEVATVISDMVDYVVERGSTTAGTVTWNYKKYHSGDLEMWGSGETTLAISTATGNIYTTASTYDVAMPSFVNSCDFITAELSGGGWVDVTDLTTPPKVRFYAPTSFASATRNLSYYMKGTWA